MDEKKTSGRRAGIQPLCPFHLDAMIEPAAGTPAAGTNDYFSCRRPYCGLRWGAATDYFRFLDGKPFRTPEQEQDETVCPQPGHGHMFISGIGIGNAVWECSVEGCSETQDKRIPQPAVWAIPKGQSQSDATASLPAQGPVPSRAAANPARGAKKRPVWVWLISVFYALSFLVLVRLIALIASGAVPASAQLSKYLASLGTFGFFLGILQPLISLAAAATLFMLRKEATYLFWLLLGFTVVSNLWTFALKSGIGGGPAKSGSPLGAIIGIGIQLFVCLYAQQLKVQGTLR
jgi:hypothetical protein